MPSHVDFPVQRSEREIWDVLDRLEIQVGSLRNLRSRLPEVTL